MTRATTFFASLLATLLSVGTAQETLRRGASNEQLIDQVRELGSTIWFLPI